LPPETAAFNTLRSKMVLIDGLNIVTASLQAGSDGGAYSAEGGTVAIMTGVPTLGQVGQQNHCAGGPSIDQRFLAKSPVPDLWCKFAGTRHARAVHGSATRVSQLDEIQRR
jgi:hypothetical protein